MNVIKASRSKTIISLLLAVGLLFSQLALAMHEVEIEKHKADTTCEVCVHASSLDHAIGGNVSQVPVTGANVRPDFQALLQSSYTQTVYRARAPPFA